MAKKKNADETSGEGESPSTAGVTEQKQPKVKDMVQAALEAGKELPKEGVAWIKGHFGVNMTPQNFSVTKSSLKSKAGGGTSSPKKRGPKVAVTPPAAKAATPVSK